MGIATSNYAAIPPRGNLGFLQRLLVRAPGWAANIAFVIAAGGFLDACSAPGSYVFEAICFLVPLILLGAVWLIHAASCVLHVLLHRRQQHDSWTRTWLRWCIIPTVTLIVIWMVNFGAPVRLRFAYSRNDLARMAEQYTRAVPIPLQHWPTAETPVRKAGAFDVSVAEVTSNGEVRFHVAGTELFRSFGGFAYSPAGAPYDPEGSFEPLGNDWYIWGTSW